jgi:hypothetical protein
MPKAFLTPTIRSVLLLALVSYAPDSPETPAGPGRIYT